jgi:putative membrane protein insertion efficiency factor
MKHVCIFLIRLYQRFLSPLKRNPTCRFYPTCSAYALEAFTKRGFFAGMALTFFRILRCHPFCPGGLDPVPMHGITIRPYYASRVGREELAKQSNESADTPDISEDANEQENAPEAGGNSSDRGENTAAREHAPAVACARYRKKQ